MPISNTLSLYDPLFYAQEGLLVLEKALGLSARVHRGYDKEPQQKGSIIKIKSPSVFTAQDAPSTAQNIVASETSITLDQWKEVKFSLTDKELSYTQEDIIRDHIRPAIYALVDKVDTTLAGLAIQSPWVQQSTNPAAIADITALRARLFDNKAPMNDGNLHLMINGTIEAEFLNIAAFSAIATAPAMEAQLAGSLGRKFGFEIFANQNVQSYTPGVAADAAGAINNVAGYAKGATTINFDGVTAAGTFLKGDVFTIAGHTQRYALTNDNTASAGAVTGATFTPGLEAAVVDDQVITFTLPSGAQAVNFAFHRHAIALAMAPLSEMGDGLGARIATATDDVNKLSLRSRVFYMPDESRMVVAYDILYGYKVLNGNLLVRYQD